MEKQIAHQRAWAQPKLMHNKVLHPIVKSVTPFAKKRKSSATFVNGACSNWTILPDSGTGELIGISGQGSYSATAETVDMPFSYEIKEKA